MWRTYVDCYLAARTFTAKVVSWNYYFNANVYTWVSPRVPPTVCLKYMMRKNLLEWLVWVHSDYSCVAMRVPYMSKKKNSRTIREVKLWYYSVVYYYLDAVYGWRKLFWILMTISYEEYDISPYKVFSFFFGNIFNLDKNGISWIK